MGKEIIWSPLADHDLNDILNYLSNEWGNKITFRFLEEVLFIIDQIAESPKRYPIIFEELSIRKCVITKHNSLFYNETPTTINILRIFDNRQNPNKLKF